MGLSPDQPEETPIALPTGDYAVSDHTRRDVDLGTMALARQAHRYARELLQTNRQCLDDLAAAALERETLTREELDEIFEAHELHQPKLPYIDEALMHLSRQGETKR
jgi:ATP-dependent Zn protease